MALEAHHLTITLKALLLLTEYCMALEPKLKINVKNKNKILYTLLLLLGSKTGNLTT